MRNFFALMLAVVSMFAMSCEPKINPVEDVKFEITSNTTVTIGAEGGLVNITFTLGGGDYTAIQATADNDTMIAGINTDDYGYVRVNVAANTEYFEREAQVRISYEGEAKIVTIKQKGKDGSAEGYEVVNITANLLIGNYYGERLVGGLGHYWIIMTDGGFVDGEMMNNAEFFRLDLLGPMAADTSNIRIPDGIYNYEATPTFMPYTIPNLGNSDYVYTDAEGEAWSVTLTEAQLVVEGSSIKLVARTEDKEFHVSFEGDYSIVENIIPDQISTLTSDYEIDLSGCSGTIRCYNDYWKCGYCNWGIEFIHNSGLKHGTYLVLDLLTDTLTNGASGVTGTYCSTGFSEEDATEPAYAEYSFIPGMRISDDGTLMMGSLLQVYEDGVGVVQAPIYGGEVQITDNGGGNYTIVINAEDDATPANKITLNWTGKLN